MVIERQGILGSITGRWTELKPGQVLWTDGTTSRSNNGRKNRRMYERGEYTSSIRVEDECTIEYFRAGPQFLYDLPYIDTYFGEEINKLARALNKRHPSMIFRYRERWDPSTNSSSTFQDQIPAQEEVRVDKNEDPRGYYRIMGVHPNFFYGLDEEEIQSRLKVCYRSAASVHHPDHGGDQEKMKLVNEAYEVLSDQSKRRDYRSDSIGDFG